MCDLQVIATKAHAAFEAEGPIGLDTLAMHRVDLVNCINALWVLASPQLCINDHLLLCTETFDPDVTDSICLILQHNNILEGIRSAFTLLVLLNHIELDAWIIHLPCALLYPTPT